jgi:hypothetical protein
MSTGVDILTGFYREIKNDRNTQLKRGQKKQMTTIKEFAKDYESTAKTKNIADLPECSTDLEILDDTYEYTDKATKTTKTVNQKVANINGENYRVPLTVIQQLKVILEDNPNLKKFKVKKSGSTKDDTRYQVIPLM